eukprot:TRINITY_DN997_c0_g1_i1.p1 TRINITY_DN997_c0_g1~~TRINITY_DN997_c0_g1_i1.p1  ORF type:complete len:219 (+),score=49.47 TRINITY_DN997_c0_g1_i1:338-994(+)
MSLLPLHMLQPPCAGDGDGDGESSPTSVAAAALRCARAPRRAWACVQMVHAEQLADAFARVLTHLCSSNAARASARSSWRGCAQPLAFFFCATKHTAFSMSDYCRRLLHLNQCSKQCVPLALVYLLRVESQRRIAINDYNVHRLVCTALVLAAKWHDEQSYSNAHYASVGGVASTHEMNILERHMLALLDHRLFVSAERYAHIESYVVQLALSNNTSV